MTPPRATASCWSICWKPRDKKFSPGIFCPGKFYVIPKPVKKLEKLFIAPKVRQVLYETSQRVFTRCACAQRTGFLIKFFNQESVSEILPEGFPEMLHVIFLPASLPACLGPFHEVHSQYHPRPFQAFGQGRRDKPKKYTPQSSQTAACQRAYKHRPAGPWGPSYNLHRFSRWVVSSVLRSFQLPAADGSREACCSHTDPTSPITKCEDKKDPSHLAGSRLSTTPIVYQTRRENKRGNLRISPGIFRKQTPPFGIFTKGFPVC